MIMKDGIWWKLRCAYTEEEIIVILDTKKASYDCTRCGKGMTISKLCPHAYIVEASRWKAELFKEGDL